MEEKHCNCHHEHHHECNHRHHHEQRAAEKGIYQSSCLSHRLSAAHRHAPHLRPLRLRQPSGSALASDRQG